MYIYIYISIEKRKYYHSPKFFEIIFCIFLLINLLTETLGISIIGYLRNDEKDGYE